MNQQPKDLSDCCNAPTYVHGSDEGTCYYVCTKCKKPCDLASWERQPASEPKKHPFYELPEEQQAEMIVQAARDSNEAQRKLMSEPDHKHTKDQKFYCPSCDVHHKSVDDVLEHLESQPASELSLCWSCNCMTKTMKDGRCGKCGAYKPSNPDTDEDRQRVIKTLGDLALAVDGEWGIGDLTAPEAVYKHLKTEMDAIVALIQEARRGEVKPFTDLQLHEDFDSTHFEPCKVCGQVSHHCMCDQALMWVERKAQERLAELNKDNEK